VFWNERSKNISPSETDKDKEKLSVTLVLHHDENNSGVGISHS